MAKLYFRYGAMNSGKSTALLQAAFNYAERGQAVLLAKPAIDTKAVDEVSSRLGVSQAVDFLIGPDDDARERFLAERDAYRRRAADALIESEAPRDIACLLVDEAQFLTPAQVDGLFRVAVEDDVPVMAYGIRTDFRTAAFPGSARLLEIAHSLEELKTMCRCGRKALFNGRLIGGRFVFDGDQVAIDAEGAAALDEHLVTYESLCGACYLRESGGVLAP
ncbi:MULTISPECIES: thymidine kinase [unclassified Microbacterium]|uniref:thymidine kinase n=1 Tax=unclassified Microbacterium TaxID=2609290 RepID=UPI00097EB3CF|nr:thymidine kinase [Microbacterium sp. JB110]RCS61467.1 thymidine kinase [Microbacterium sp. JB110]SJM65698.1 Thymidine kinase [Frigoribacterium sp. JB110]